jgi:hypothetical protein
MKISYLIVSGLFTLALVTLTLATASLPAQALTRKECSAKYQAAKAAGTLNGMKWNDFRKAQCGAEAPAAAPAAETPAAPPPAATTAAKPASPGRAAMIARERACGAEWKAAKANGTRPPGMKWPQFWHECDVRKKAEGM